MRGKYAYTSGFLAVAALLASLTSAQAVTSLPIPKPAQREEQQPPQEPTAKPPENTGNSAAAGEETSVPAQETPLKEPEPKPNAKPEIPAAAPDNAKKETKEVKPEPVAKTPEKPTETIKTSTAVRSSKNKSAAKMSTGDEEDLMSLPITDAEETYNLPEYPMGARISIGKMETYKIKEEDTLLDIARHYGLGYVEIRSANPDIDPWTPVPDEEVVIPNLHLLPRARQEGIVVNLAEMRMYYFRKPGGVPETFAIGIGKDGLQTPTGETTVTSKVAGPVWHPTDRMRQEKPYLPAAVGAGPSNPLGTHALYLGWPTFLIHGSNKPWAIGRRVSSGCMRMYPEDIIRVFNETPVGTKITVVDQPILLGWVDNTLYLEANPTKTQSNQLEIEGEFKVKGLSDPLKNLITDTAGVAAKNIDWMTVEKIVRERRGYPIAIAQAGGKAAASKKKEPVKSQRFN